LAFQTKAASFHSKEHLLAPDGELRQALRSSCRRDLLCAWTFRVMSAPSSTATLGVTEVSVPRLLDSFESRVEDQRRGRPASTIANGWRARHSLAPSCF
jgi:hypothetical protein